MVAREGGGQIAIVVEERRWQRPLLAAHIKPAPASTTNNLEEESMNATTSSTSVFFAHTASMRMVWFSGISIHLKVSCSRGGVFRSVSGSGWRSLGSSGMEGQQPEFGVSDQE